MQDIAVEERLQRVKGAVAKIRKKDDAEEQGEDAVGEDRLDAGRECDTGGRAGVGALAGFVRCDAINREFAFVCGGLTCTLPKAPTGNERQRGKEHHEHEHRARRRCRRNKAAQCRANDDTHV